MIDRSRVLQVKQRTVEILCLCLVTSVTQVPCSSIIYSNRERLTNKTSLLLFLLLFEDRRSCDDFFGATLGLIVGVVGGAFATSQAALHSLLAGVAVELCWGERERQGKGRVVAEVRTS